MTSGIKLRCFPFPLTMFPFDWSPVRGWVDGAWRGKTHVCLYKVQQLTARVRAQTEPWNLRDCLRYQSTSSFHQCTLTMFKPSWSSLTKVEASLQFQGQGEIQKAASQIQQCLISGECRMTLCSCSYCFPVFQSWMIGTAAGSLVSEWVRKGTLIYTNDNFWLLVIITGLVSICDHAADEMRWYCV